MFAQTLIALQHHFKCFHKRIIRFYLTLFDFDLLTSFLKKYSFKRLNF